MISSKLPELGLLNSAPLLLKSGDCHFLYDNWLGSGALANRVDSISDHRVCDFVNQGVWNYSFFRDWLPPEFLAEVLRVSPPSSQSPDGMVWSLTTTGSFSLSSAFQVVRNQKNTSFIFGQI